MGRTNWSADRHMSAVSAINNLRAYSEGVTIPGNPWFRLTGCSAWDVPWQLDDPDSPGVVYPPVPDWSAWSGPPESVADFMNALESTFTWYTIGVAEGVQGWAARPAYSGAPGSRLVLCNVADWMLPYVSGRAYAAQAIPLSQLPPIWPGAEYATMGSLVSLAEHWTIDEPLNGVLVSIATVAPGMGRYDWDDYSQYPRAGYVTFLSDSGCLEDPQPVTFEAHIVCPKLCRTATRAVGRCKAGVSGFAQAWTFTLP